MNKERMMIRVLLVTLLFIGLTGVNSVNGTAVNDRPRVIVTNYELENGGIAEGKTNKLMVTLKNMNQNYSVYSVLITTEILSDNVYIQYGESNQNYIEKLMPNEEKQVEILLETTDHFTTDKIECFLSIIFEDEIGFESSTKTALNLPIMQDHLKIQRVYIPNTVTKNVKARVSTTFENIENDDLYNVVMRVKGGAINDVNVDLGTINSGSRKNQEVYVEFEALGENHIVFEFDYEDSKGKSYTTKTKQYQVNVLENIVYKDKSEEMTVVELSKLELSVKQKGYLIGLCLCVVSSLALLRKEIVG